MNFIKRKEFSGHSAGIYSLEFDGTFLYSGSADKFVARWNISEGIQDKFSIRFENSIYSICLINDCKYLVAGLSNGDLHIFDLQSKQEIKFYTQHKSAIFSIAENPVKNQFYSSDSDGNLAVWDSISLELLLFIPLDCGKIRRIAISPEGSSFALACQDGNIRIFETEFFNELHSFSAHSSGVTAVLFHPTEPSIMLSGGKDALLKVWKWKEAELLKEIPAHNYVIYDIISINEGRNFLTCSRDKTIKVWKTGQFTFLQRLDLKIGGHKHSVNCLLKINEKQFVSASDDKRMLIWEETFV